MPDLAAGQPQPDQHGGQQQGGKDNGDKRRVHGRECTIWPRGLAHNARYASQRRGFLSTSPSESTPATLAPSENNLIWIDLEMTGLKPETDRIIEIAVIVTDPHLTVRVEGPVFAVHQSDATLDQMDAWNKG